MAVDFHERKSFLPPELLTDDVSLSKNRTFTLNGSGNVSVSNGFGSTGSSWSGLSSAFGSELGSTETESEEEEEDDDFIAELTRQMADYMLQEDDEKPTKDCGSEILKISSGLPQHSLTLFPQHDHQAFCDDQEDQAIQLYNVENQPSVENQGQVCRRGKVKKTESTQQEEQNKLHQLHSRGTGVFGSPAMSWQQVNPGSDMRAVFLGRSGARIGSSGTGVFLPRGSDNPPAFQKKLGCSTVLIPARVLHALQLHYQNISKRSQSNGGAGLTSYPLQHDIAASRPTSNLYSHQKQVSQSQTRSVKNSQEIYLPQEWTY